MLGRGEKVPQFKITAVQYAILAIFLILGFRLARLQIASSGRFETLAERNRVRTIPILAPRGKILDREGRVLVDNYPSFSALLLRDQIKDISNDVPRIAAGLNMTSAQVHERIKRFAYAPQFQPIVLKDDITPAELAFVESHRNELPELETIMVHRRLYPKDGFMAHLIGYVGEVSEDMLNQPQYELYEPGDVVGKSGVEQYYNDILMGKDGSRRSYVNSHGKEIERLNESPALPGKQLRLTIDLDLQIAAEEAIEGSGHHGAIVAMDPRNGEILAMVSRPTFNPNDFAVRISRDEWNQLVTDENHPLLNKAIQAQLAPGSVFKIIMATAGMQEGVAQDMHVNCGGGKVFYGRFFKCWITSQHTTHGIVDISKAIYQSCDSFFYTLADRLGIGRIAKYASTFGLGQKTHIDLPNEVTGVMPSEEWKIKNFKEKWYAGETISVGIGQGAVAVTPIQLARAIGGITSGGVLRRPHVAFPDQLPPNYVQAMAQYPSEVKAAIDPQNWEIITDAMANVVSPLGTAPSARLVDIDFAGKTGSSQTISNTGKAKLSGNKAKFKDNGWFVGVTPRRNPEIVVAVLLEEGEHGYLAARVCSQVIKSYVEKQRKRAVKMASAARPEEVQVAALWHTPQPAAMHSDAPDAGKFALALTSQAKPAEAAPGIPVISRVNNPGGD